MAGPGDEIAAGAGGRGHLRASHADREQVIGALKAAFVQGRLDRDEFDLRVSQAFASRTYAELAAVTADLPAGLAEARLPKPARGSVNKQKKAVVALSFATLAIAGIMAAPTPSIPDGPFAVLVIFVFWFLLLAVSTGGFGCSTHGLTSALAGSPRRGCHRAQAVKHPSTCHRPSRAGSCRRAMTAAGTPPTLRRSVAPACSPAKLSRAFTLPCLRGAKVA